MTQDTEDVVALLAAEIREVLNEQGGSCADALQDGEVVPDTGIYWFYGHQIDIPALARAALEVSGRQSLSDRIDVLEDALAISVAALGRVNVRCFDRASSPLKPLGDIAREALSAIMQAVGDETYDTIARAALHQEGIAP